MNIDELEKRFFSIDDEILDQYYHRILGSKDYTKLSKIATKLEYKGVANMFKLNFRGAYETNLNPNKFQETHLALREQNLLTKVRNPDVFDWSPIMNYFYIRFNRRYFNRALSKIYSELSNEQNNYSAAEFLRDGTDRQIAFKQISGSKVLKEDFEISAGMTKMIDLAPLSSQLIPTFALGKNGDVIFRISILLEERGVINNRTSFDYLFSPGQEWNGSNYKLNWNSTIGVLVYLFLLLIDYEILDTYEHFDLNSKLTVFKKGGKYIPYNSIKVELGRIKKRYTKDYPKRAKNKGFQTIYDILEIVISDVN